MIKLGKKQLIINDASQAPLLFFSILAGGTRRLVETDDDYQTTNPFDNLATSPDTQSGAEGADFLPAEVDSTSSLVAQADMLRIVGFADLVGANIASVVGTKGVPDQKQVSTLTFVISSVVVGEEIIVELKFASENFEGDFASHLSDYKLKRSLVLVVKAGDTATLLAERLVADINSIAESGWQSYLTASNVAGVVTLTSTKGSVSFKAVAKGSAIDAAHATATFATTTVGYPGRNTYDQLKGVRLETSASVYPHAPASVAGQLPIKGHKYSTYTIKKIVTRPDLVGFNDLNQEPSGKYELELIINETTCAAYITALTTWLNANVAVRTMYTATTANAAIAAENPSPTSVVDSAAPFTTGLN